MECRFDVGAAKVQTGQAGAHDVWWWVAQWMFVCAVCNMTLILLCFQVASVSDPVCGIW